MNFNKKGGACVEIRRRENHMDKWMLISICNRDLEPIKMFETAEGAQAAMKADFINTIGANEFQQVCDTNGEPCCEDWMLSDFNAWISNMDSIDWHIVRIVA